MKNLIVDKYVIDISLRNYIEKVQWELEVSLHSVRSSNLIKDKYEFLRLKGKS